MIALFELFLRLTCIYDIRRKMQIYGAHVLNELLLTRESFKQTTTNARS